MVKQDWRAVYTLYTFGVDDKKELRGYAAFEAGIKEENDSHGVDPVHSSIIESMKAASDSIIVGEPIIDGDNADVPTGIKFQALGKTINMKGMAHMVNEGGIWKLNFTSLNEGDTSKVTLDLFGKP